MTPEQLIHLIKNKFRYRKLYHFSDRSNWDTINQFGLLSKKELDDLGIVPPQPGGDFNSRESDKSNGIYDYVSLSFTPQHPMAYCCREDGRHPNQIWVTVDPDALLTPGIKIAMGLANAHDTSILDLCDGVNELDTEIWREDHGLPFDQIKHRVDAMKRVEILVPKTVVRASILDYWIV